MTERLLLRPAEAAEVIGFSRAKTYELIAEGVIPSVRIGGCIRVPVAGLARCIEERTAVHDRQGTVDRREDGLPRPGPDRGRRARASRSPTTSGEQTS